MDNKYFQALITILKSIENIEEFIGNPRIFEKYDKNLMVQQAVERNLEIIGEAINRINSINPDVLITNKRKIISARNKIIHGYDEIENVQIWNIVINYLPQLKIEITELIDKEKN